MKSEAFLQDTLLNFEFNFCSSIFIIIKFESNKYKMYYYYYSKHGNTYQINKIYHLQKEKTIIKFITKTTIKIEDVHRSKT